MNRSVVTQLYPVSKTSMGFHYLEFKRVTTDHHIEGSAITTEDLHQRQRVVIAALTLQVIITDFKD